MQRRRSHIHSAWTETNRTEIGDFCLWDSHKWKDIETSRVLIHLEGESRKSRLNGGLKPMNVFYYTLCVVVQKKAEEEEVKVYTVGLAMYAIDFVACTYQLHTQEAKYWSTSRV